MIGNFFRQKAFEKLADNRREKSLASRLRKRRFSMFKQLLLSLPRPISILDVGGTPQFWQSMKFLEQFDVKIVLLNLMEIAVSNAPFDSIVGDGRNMSQFQDNEFTVVFSNSVIEHVGDYQQQRKFAQETRRVGKIVYIQTPNRLFPIEPHFLIPFFHFLPLRSRISLVRHFTLGWYHRIIDLKEASEAVTSINLLTGSELAALYPGTTIYKEKILGLTKSFTVIG
jgi:hypothetical protein